MDELIERLQQQAGLSPEQSQKAASVFADFLANNVSDDQIQQIAAKIPGIGQYSDRIPSDVGDRIGDAARKFLNRG